MDVDGEEAAPLAVCNANMSNNREENFSYRIARYPNWFFLFFFALLLFSLMAFMTMRSVIDDGMTTWRVLSFFFSEGWQRGIELFEFMVMGRKEEQVFVI